MFTVPDGPDAVSQLPPIGPIGPTPSGFFADCNPGTGFAGTRPLAEHFNELIINLRALLALAGVAPAKGDETMLWRAILRASTITTWVNIQVATSGSANPSNPFAGQPFDSLQHALDWLGFYRIASSGFVTINVAAGTYTMPGTLYIDHPSGARISIQGGGSGNTILLFPAGQAGVVVPGLIYSFRGFTLEGSGGSFAGLDGFYVYNGEATIGDLRVQNFGGNGVSVQGNGFIMISGTVTV